MLNFFSIFSSCLVHQIKLDCEDLSCKIIHVMYSFAFVRAPVQVDPLSLYATDTVLPHNHENLLYQCRKFTFLIKISYTLL